jgi:hypothetical protein
MRPTTSTNNSKTSGKPFEKLRSWVPLSEIKIQFNNLTKFLRLVVSVVLPTQDIILNEIAARRVKFGFEILVLERKFVNREGKWNWLIVISTMATDGAAEFMSNYGRSVLIPIYEISRNYEKRKGGGRRIFLSETEIRIYETQVTKSRNLTRYW